jgi:hypothetical protein
MYIFSSVMVVTKAETCGNTNNKLSSDWRFVFPFSCFLSQREIIYIYICVCVCVLQFQFGLISSLLFRKFK